MAVIWPVHADGAAIFHVVARARIAGPAVIEEMSATTWLPPGWTLWLGDIGQMELVRTTAPFAQA